MIFHVDVNSAFLSWEAVRRVKEGKDDLRLVPSIVGGDPAKRTSVVLAKSVPAKKYGIQTGEPVAAALKKCPSLVIVPSDFHLYKQNSHAFKEICRQYAPVVEEFSIDECFLDMTGTSRIYPDLIATAYELKDKIHADLGFTVNVGIGPNKLLAKMAGDFEKPDKVHTLFPEEIPEKMWPLPVGDLLFCGKATAEKLRRAKILTIGDLAKMPLAQLQLLVGKRSGLSLHEHANGIDHSVVSDQPEEAKSYSNETTFEDDITSYERAELVLLHLADSVASRIRRDKIKAFCICVTIRGNDMKKRSHQQNLPAATDITTDIYHAAVSLLRELWDGQTPLRLLGLGVTNLDRGEFEQLSLFEDPDKEKKRSADQAADRIREKFGRGSIMRGSMLQSDILVDRKRRYTGYT